MTATAGYGPGEPIDPVPVAALFGAVAGLLSVAFPFFEGLTAALSALLLVSRLYRLPYDRGPARSPWRTGGAVAAAGLGWAAFFGAPAALAPVRGLLLGGAGVLFWWWTRAERAQGRGTR